MKVIVDTCIWSLALRRGSSPCSPIVMELENLIKDFKVQIIGPIRQEILSGIRSQSQFANLKKRLGSFQDLPILTKDYEKAAEFYNLCMSKGIQGSNTDFLICAVANRNKFSLYTTDKDFQLFSKHLPIKLHAVK